MEAEHGRLKLWLDGAAGKPSLSLPPETSEADVKPPQTSRNGEAANRMRGRENSGLGWERGREQHNWRETGGSWTNEKEKEWTKAVRALAHGPKDASKIVRRISLSPSPRAKKPPSPSAQRFSIATSGQEISRRRSVSPTRPFAPADSITSQRHSREFSPSPTGKRTVLSLVTSLRGRSSQRKSPSSPQAPVLISAREADQRDRERGREGAAREGGEEEVKSMGVCEQGRHRCARCLLVLVPAIALRACYAIPGTDMTHGVLGYLRMCYAIPGTDTAYGARILRAWRI
eukprot:403836-Rhodomonas_salina.1